MQGSQDEFYPKQLEEHIFLENAQKDSQLVTYKKWRAMIIAISLFPLSYMSISLSI